MLLLLRLFTALALAVWLGSMVFFAAVAPTAFSVLPTRELAGNVVNGTMRTLQTIAYVAGGVALAALLLRLPLERGLKMITIMKAAIVSFMLFISIFAGVAIAAPMAEMRSRIGTIDKLPEDDPQRVRFNQLHKVSVMLMGVNMLAAIAVIGLEQVREPRNAPTA